MPGKVRRIVTGINAAGRSYIESDVQMPIAELAPGDRVRAGMWVTDRAPASNETPDPVPDGVIPTIAPAARGGTVFRVVDMPPDSGQPGNPHELSSRGAHVSAERSAKHPGF